MQGLVSTAGKAQFQVQEGRLGFIDEEESSTLFLTILPAILKEVGDGSDLKSPCDFQVALLQWVATLLKPCDPPRLCRAKAVLFLQSP